MNGIQWMQVGVSARTNHVLLVVGLVTNSAASCTTYTGYGLYRVATRIWKASFCQREQGLVFSWGKDARRIAERSVCPLLQKDSWLLSFSLFRGLCTFVRPLGSTVGKQWILVLSPSERLAEGSRWFDGRRISGWKHLCSRTVLLSTAFFLFMGRKGRFWRNIDIRPYKIDNNI